MSAPSNFTLPGLDDRQKLTAAISTSFDPVRLFPDGAGDAAAGIDQMAAVCDEVEVAGADYPHWRMRADARRGVLEDIAQRTDLTAVLDSIDVEPTDALATYLVDGLRGRDLTRIVEGDGGPAASGDRPDLDGLLGAVRLLEQLEIPTVVSGEAEATVQRRIALEDADEALRAVMPRRLIGRDAEYTKLVAFRTRDVHQDPSWVPSLVIEGPGGAGKSALVSTFVYDQRHGAEGATLVYFYLSRPALPAALPADLTFEFARQLSLSDISLQSLIADYSARSLELRAVVDEGAIDFAAGSSTASLQDLGSLLSDWSLRKAPVTLVLDTFEQISIQGAPAVRALLTWCAQLRDYAKLPRLRLIVSGRAVLPDPGSYAKAQVQEWFNRQDTMPLGDLDDEYAVEMLVELGIDRRAAERVPAVFGGNPLVLKLIARYEKANDADAFSELLRDGQSERHRSPSAEIGLRFVYERILSRIRQPRVKALAYPGVVLRRVTPELILEVLAPALPAELDVSTLDDAQSAFDELAEHVWLVSRTARWEAMHRADVRRLLIPGLESSKDIDTPSIHARAADYYDARPSDVPPAVARTESVYHRGFVEDVAYRMSAQEADEIVRALGEDLEFWPVQRRAELKSLAGRHIALSEEEVSALSNDAQLVTRGARMSKYRSYGDSMSSGFEEQRLDELGTIETIPDPRWILLFDRGEFMFISESARRLETLERYFNAHPYLPPSTRFTQEHPWFIALAELMMNRPEPALLSPRITAEMRWHGPEAHLYAAALAAIAGDRRAHSEMLDLVRAELRSVIEVTLVDELTLLQAAASGGGLDDVRSPVQVFSFDHFRLPHLEHFARRAAAVDLENTAREATHQFARRRPTTTELADLRARLTRGQGTMSVRDIRGAPTLLSFLYGAVRTILAPMNRDEILAAVAAVDARSIYWPVDQTAEALGSTRSADLAPEDLTAVIETADRCGLLVELVDQLRPRAGTENARRLKNGIIRLEALLFPLAPRP